MNDANDFYQDMHTRHQAVIDWREGSNTGDGADAQSVSQRSLSGNGNTNGDGEAETKNGTPSQQEKGVSLTPNG